MKTTVKVTLSPAATVSGVAGVGSTEKSVEPINRCTLEMTRSAPPTLSTVSVRYSVGPQTIPKLSSS